MQKEECLRKVSILTSFLSGLVVKCLCLLLHSDEDLTQLLLGNIFSQLILSLSLQSFLGNQNKSDRIR